MADALEIQIAPDGVQEVPLTRARAYLTRLIEQAREDGLVSALTVRGRRRAYVVTPDLYEQATEDRITVQALQRMLDEMPDRPKGDAFMEDLRRYRQDITGPPK